MYDFPQKIKKRRRKENKLKFDQKLSVVIKPQKKKCYSNHSQRCPQHDLTSCLTCPCAIVRDGKISTFSKALAFLGLARWGDKICKLWNIYSLAKSTKTAQHRAANRVEQFLLKA